MDDALAAIVKFAKLSNSLEERGFRASWMSVTTFKRQRTFHAGV